MAMVHERQGVHCRSNILKQTGKGQKLVWPSFYKSFLISHNGLANESRRSPSSSINMWNASNGGVPV